MDFSAPDPERLFMAAWNAVEIARPVHYSLFTFGESELPYYLVVDSKEDKTPVKLSKGMVKVTRPLIVTPGNAPPEFENFFEDDGMGRMASFLMSRQAAFKHLRFDNRETQQQTVTDSVEEMVSKLNRQLDGEDEDRVAILTAPHSLGGIAVLRYAAERVMRSAKDNIQELRERGFLPEE
jgi:hypothetical protein